ncbi:talin-B-like [Schistocerca gregaria]|uniref:talin-B-like n=1 Tax=Schistocerca gregaria TaxID=7010 RepID=UPI00211DE2B8|nr:talin-B-like [Schistocerca gregaria]
MASVNVKIIIGDFTKVFRFSVDSFVADAIKEIQHKLGQEGGDHGLYQPAYKGKKARWLKGNRTLKFYNIVNDTELEYKKKHRILKIKLPDESQRSILIDASLPIRDIIQAVGEKLMIKDFDQYGMRRPNAPETEWLDSNRLLCEEDVPDDEILLFAKKLFYNDFTVDKDDPMQLHLIYVQASNSVVNGKYDPLQRREVVDLAAMQAQILYGNYDAARFQKMQLDLAKLVPASWRKDKKIEKEIIKEYQKLVGTNEINAKYRYLQIVRSLKTYGISFFEVSEKVKGKKKMQKAYLGITRDRILKLDGETRETVKEWGIEQLRRWAPTNNSLTLDFGDYEEDYVVLQTEEGDQMSRMIADYIDIILKAQGGVGQIETEDNSKDAYVGSVMAASGIAMNSITSSVSTNYAPIGNYPSSMVMPQHVGSIMQPNAVEYSAQGVMSPAPSSMAGSPSSLQAQRPSIFPQTQSFLVNDLPSAIDSLNVLSAELDNGLKGFTSTSTLSPQQWANQLETSNQEFSASLSELLKNARGEFANWDVNAIEAQAQDLQLKTLAVAVSAKHVAAFENDASLLNSAKSVSQSMVDLLTQIRSCTENPQAPPSPRQLKKLAQAEKRAKLAMFSMSQAANHNYVDEGTEMFLQECVANISSSIEDVVDSTLLAIEDVTSPEIKSPLQSEFDDASIYLDWVADNLASLVPIASAPESQSKISEITGEAKVRIDDLIGKVMEIDEVTEPKKARLESSQQRVNKCVSMFNLAAGLGEKHLKTVSSFDLNQDKPLMDALSQIRENIDSPKMLVGPTKTCVNALNDVINSVKDICEICDPSMRERMTRAGRNIGQTSEALLESVKALNKNPGDQQSREEILEAVGKLETYIEDIEGDAGPKAAMLNLNYTTKAMLAKVIRTKNCVDSALNEVSDPSARSALAGVSEQLESNMNRVLPALMKTVSNPGNTQARQELQSAIKLVTPPIYESIVLAKKNQKSVSDLNKKQELAYACEELSNALKRLDKSSKMVTAMQKQPEIEDAMHELDIVRAELDAMEFALSSGGALNSTGVGLESARDLCRVSGQTLTESIDAMIEDALTSGTVSNTVKKVSSAMTQMAVAVRAMAGSYEDAATQKSVIESAQGMLGKVSDVVRRSRMVGPPEDESKRLTLESGQMRPLREDYEEYREKLSELLNTGQGQDTQFIDESLGEMRSERLNLARSPPSVASGNAAESMENYVTAMKGVATASSELANLVASRGRGVAPMVSLLSSVTARLIKCANEAVASTPERAGAQRVIEATSRVVDDAESVLERTKGVLEKDTFAAVAALKEANDVLVADVASASRVSTSACTGSINRIMEMMASLDKPGKGVEKKSLEAVLDEFTRCSESLGSVVPSVVSASTHEALDRQSERCAAAVQKLVEATQSAMSLSEAPVDDRLAKLDQYLGQMQSTCGRLEESEDNLSEAVALSKSAGMTATDLLLFAKQVASELSAPEHKSQQQAILRAAKQMASTTTTLVKASSGIGAKSSREGIEQLVQCAKALSQRTRELESAIKESVKQTGLMQGGQRELGGVEAGVLDGLVSASKQVAFLNAKLLNTAQSSLPKKGARDAKGAQQLNQVVDQVTSAMGDLVSCYSSLHPSTREVSELESKLLEKSSAMNMQVMRAIAGGAVAAPESGQNRVSCQNRLAEVSGRFAERLSELAESVKEGDAQRTSRSVREVGRSVDEFCEAASGCIATGVSRADRLKQAQGAKRVLDALNVVLQQVRDQSVGAGAEGAREVGANILRVSEMLESVGGRAVAGMETIDEALERVSKCSEYVSGPVRAAKAGVNVEAVNKEIQDLVVQELMGAVQELAITTPSTMGRLSKVLPKAVRTIERVCQKLVETQAPGEEYEEKVGALKSFLQAMQANLENLKHLAMNPSDLNAQMLQSDSSMQLFGGLSRFLDSMRGVEQSMSMCERALEGINRLLAQVSSASLFVNVNQQPASLENEAVQSTVLGYQSEISDILNESVRPCLAREGSSKSLGRVATSLHEDLEKLVNLSLKAANGMNNVSTQQSLLSGIKALNHRAHQYILVSRNFEQNQSDPALLPMVSSAEASLRKAVDEFCDLNKGAVDTQNTCSNQLRTTKRGLEAVMNRDFREGKPSALTSATIDNLFHNAQSCSSVLTDVVLATSQADLIESTRSLQKCIEALSADAITVTKDPSVAPAVRAEIQETIKNLCKSSIELLDAINMTRENPKNAPQIDECSSSVSAALQAMYDALKKLPNTPQNVLSVDTLGIDVDERASAELSKCAKVLEDACQSLINSMPSSPPVRAASALGSEPVGKSPSELVNGAIRSPSETVYTPVVTGALEITKASARLIVDATNIQNERAKHRKEIKAPHEKYRNDPTWANGLISAARSVAFSVEQLVSAAKAAIRQEVDKEVLTASVHAVSSSTAHLVSASRVKADPNSKLQISLSESASAVNRATAALFQSTQPIFKQQEERPSAEDIPIVPGVTSAKAKFDQQIRILRLEAEVERERRRLAEMKRSEYQS